MLKKIVVLLFCVATLGGCTQKEIAQSQPAESAKASSQSSRPQSISSSATSDGMDTPTFMGKEPEESSDTSDSTNKDFEELYPNGLFQLSVVDSAGKPIPNAAVTVNLDWPMTAERTTDTDGILMLPLPQLSGMAFISGDYEFTITQQTLTEPHVETVVCALSQQNTMHGYTIKLSAPATEIDWAQAKQSLVISVYRQGMPQKNLTVEVVPNGYSWPDSSGLAGLHTLKYSDGNGSVRYANIPAGDYIAVVKGNGGVQLVAQSFTAIDSGTETLHIDLPLVADE